MKNKRRIIKKSGIVWIHLYGIALFMLKYYNKGRCSRAKGTARERSDIDIAVSGIEDFEALIEKVEDLPTLYSVDLVNMDTCKNQLLLEDIRQYGRKI